MANEIEIRPVLNGWSVRAGCQEVVFTSAAELCNELKKFLDDPEATRKRYLAESVNRRWTAAQEQRTENCGAQCEGPIPSVKPDPSRLVAGPAARRIG